MNIAAFLMEQIEDALNAYRDFWIQNQPPGPPYEGLPKHLRHAEDALEWLKMAPASDEALAYQQSLLH